MRFLSPSILAALLAAGAAHAASVVVNEVQTAGPAGGSDEFVEIANTSAAPVDLTGWKIVYRTASGTTDTVLVRFVQGDAIASGATLVFGGTAYTGPKDGPMSGSLAATGGGVAVLNAAGARVDSVGYGDSTTNAYVETHPAVAPPAAHSIHRIPCGRDTDDNRSDFQDLFPPTPKVACSGTSPVVESVAFSPAIVDPGGSTVLTAIITPHGSPVASAAANLSALGGSPAAPLQNTSSTTWQCTVAVPAGATPGPVQVIVSARDAAGGAGAGAGLLRVRNPVPGPVVINEVQTAGASTTTEFIELYNRSGASVDLAGWTLVYRAPSGSTDSTLCTLGPVTIHPNKTFLLATDDYTGPRDAAMNPGLGTGSGSVALKDAYGAVLDSVGYGSADNDYVEIAPAPSLSAGESIERSPIGQDTNNNAADFALLKTPTPTTSAPLPSVPSVAFNPAAVDPGGATTLTATVVPGSSAIARVTADLTSVGLAYEEPLSHDAGNAWTKAITVSPLTTPGTKTVVVVATDSTGLIARRSGTLSVNGPEPPPVKINEIKTAGSTSGADEFVEIHNPSTADADLYGWSLVYRGPTGAEDSTLFTFGRTPLKAGGYMVICGSAYTGTKDGSLSGSLGAEGGAAGLRDPYGRLVDSAGYGTAANALVEGTPAKAPSAGQSIERSPAGQDTNNNAADFHVLARPTPTPLSACPSICAVGCSPNPAAPGQAAVLSATLTAGASAIASAAADLSPIGGPAGAALIRVAGDTWNVSFTVPASAPAGAATLAVKATDAAGVWARGSCLLSVTASAANNRGDVNRDGAVDMRDALLALKAAAGLLRAADASVSLTSADVWPAAGGDGRITLADAARIARAASGNEAF